MHNRANRDFSQFVRRFLDPVSVSSPAMTMSLASPFAFVILIIAITIALLGEEQRRVGLAPVTLLI